METDRGGDLDPGTRRRKVGAQTARAQNACSFGDITFAWDAPATEPTPPAAVAVRRRSRVAAENKSDPRREPCAARSLGRRLGPPGIRPREPME